MTQTTKQPTLENSVSIAYATKCLAPYLQITVPELPQRGFTDRIKELPSYAFVLAGTIINLVEKADRVLHREARESYQRDRQTRRELLAAREEDDRQFFAEYGAETLQEKDVCVGLYDAGRYVKSMVNNPLILPGRCIHAVENDSRQLPISIKLYAQSLSDLVHHTVNEVVRRINSEYGAKVVNPSFRRTSEAWLKEEINQRLAQGKVEFLEAVVLETKGNLLEMKQKQ